MHKSMNDSIRSGQVELHGSATTMDEGLAVLELEVGAGERALLEEAMRLTGLDAPGEVLRIALRELVERQRFLSWVAAHDRAERTGTA